MQKYFKETSEKFLSELLHYSGILTYKEQLRLREGQKSRLLILLIYGNFVPCLLQQFPHALCV
jgi:hypothetical protein